MSIQQFFESFVKLFQEASGSVFICKERGRFSKADIRFYIGRFQAAGRMMEKSMMRNFFCITAVWLQENLFKPMTFTLLTNIFHIYISCVLTSMFFRTFLKHTHWTKQFPNFSKQYTVKSLLPQPL